MFKRSLSRNTRAKGIKVKHVVQILILLGICIWLIFQVKHSRDKKKELNDEEERVSGKMQNDPGFLKLGRKDLDPREEKPKTSEKHDDEDEDGTGEHDKGMENQDREDRKHEEAENDEIDENDREKSGYEIETDKEKDDGDGETERDEKQAEEKNSSEERDRDETTRGAREKHYKGDDASSAVAHDPGSIVSQTEEVISDLNNLEHEKKSSDRTTGNGNSTEDGSPQNSILATDLNGPDQVRTEAGNHSAQNPVSAESLPTETPANVSVDGTGNDPVSDNTHSDPNPTISIKGNETVVVLSNSFNDAASDRSSEFGSKPLESKENVGTEPGEERADLKNGSENPHLVGPVDSTDSHVAHEMNETRVELDTSPEIRTEIDRSDETAAE